MATRGRPPMQQASADTGKRLQDYPAHARNNPLKVHGEALRELGRRHGISRSSMDRMDDAKLRSQISFAQSNEAQAGVA